MKKVYWIGAAAFAVALATTASAQTTTPAPAPAPATDSTPAPAAPTKMEAVKAFVAGGSPYFGIGVGAATTDGLSGVTGSTIVSGDAYKLSGKILGGWAFSPNWGIEAQFTDLGSRNVTASIGSASAGGNTTAHQFSIAGTGTVTVSERLSLIGKMGASNNHLGGTNFCVSNAYCSGYIGSKTDFMWGAGINYSITKRLVLRMEYEEFGKFSGSGGPNGVVTATGGPTGGTVRGDNIALDLIWSF